MGNRANRQVSSALHVAVEVSNFVKTKTLQREASGLWQKIEFRCFTKHQIWSEEKQFAVLSIRCFSFPETSKLKSVYYIRGLITLYCTVKEKCEGNNHVVSLQPISTNAAL